MLQLLTQNQMQVIAQKLPALAQARTEGQETPSAARLFIATQ
jgi:hypothetical protein